MSVCKLQLPRTLAAMQDHPRHSQAIFQTTMVSTGSQDTQLQCKQIRDDVAALTTVSDTHHGVGAFSYILVVVQMSCQNVGVLLCHRFLSTLGLTHDTYNTTVDIQQCIFCCTCCWVRYVYQSCKVLTPNRDPSFSKYLIQFFCDVQKLAMNVAVGKVLQNGCSYIRWRKRLLLKACVLPHQVWVCVF
jgi:hypothetical protein